MKNPGRNLIIGIFAVALAATLLSLWYHYQSGRQALAYWGTQTAVLIAHAPEVSVLRLEPADRPSPADGAASDGDRPIQRLGIGGRFYRVADEKDAAQSRGVGNIRRAMVLDGAYQWDRQDAGPPTWQYAMQFRDGDRSAIVFFDFDTAQVGTSTQSETAFIDPAASNDWRGFFAEQFEADTNEQPAN